MADHWYWCVDCKTSGCLQRHPLAYIGSDPDWTSGPVGASLARRPPFEISCPYCAEVHRYSIEADVRPQKLAQPPPPGFRNQLQ